MSILFKLRAELSKYIKISIEIYSIQAIVFIASMFYIPEICPIIIYDYIKFMVKVSMVSKSMQIDWYQIKIIFKN